jgi:8-oxo-dGTP diphosphatase
MRHSVAGISVRDGTYFVARRLPGGDMGGKWEFPGGKVEAGEGPVDALHREYDEEFCVPIKVGPPIGEVGFFHHGEEYSLAAFYVELVASDGDLKPSEHSEWRWATLDEILELDFADSDSKLLPFLI